MKKFFSNKINFLASLCFILCLTIILIDSCKKKEDTMIVNGNPAEPKLPPQPYNYPSSDDDIATLGRVLFYDKNISLNSSIACGSCHKQQYAFADNHQFSRGLYNGYTSRNSSAILSSFHSKFWDGRAEDFDEAVFMPVMNHVEMDIFNLNILSSKLSRLSYYPDLFKAAYGDTEITVEKIRTALSEFLDNFSSFNSKYDTKPLNAIERQGFNIFTGKGRCYGCHNGFNFNGYDDSYENIGLEVNYADRGRGKITNDANDDGKFLVPTLRNIALTAPYMHDGRFKTLREVIDHYNEGIQDSKNLSWVLRDFSGFSFPIVKLGLTENEKVALEKFLETLTDVNFISDPKYSNPF